MLRPSRSTDLDPVEQPWDILDQLVKQRSPPPSSKHHLFWESTKDYTPRHTEAARSGPAVYWVTLCWFSLKFVTRLDRLEPKKVCIILLFKTKELLPDSISHYQGPWMSNFAIKESCECACAHAHVSIGLFHTVPKPFYSKAWKPECDRMCNRNVCLISEHVKATPVSVHRRRAFSVRTWPLYHIPLPSPVCPGCYHFGAFNLPIKPSYLFAQRLLYVPFDSNPTTEEKMGRRFIRNISTHNEWR